MKRKKKHKKIQEIQDQQKHNARKLQKNVSKTG